jgi:transposase
MKRQELELTEQNLHLDTVYDRRKNWLARGLMSLADKHRSGTPPKLNEGHKEQLRLWATQQALTARQLLSKLHEEFDLRIHVNTLTNTLRQMGFVCKRTRHSLKKSAMK